MISCFRPAPANRKPYCVRTSFLASFVNRSAEFFAVSLCTGSKRSKAVTCVSHTAGKALRPFRGKKSHYRRVSEVDFSKTYKIGRTLGVGGFSIVKTGTNILTGEPVAIKIIDRSKYGPKDASLEREIQVLEKVQHENCICFKECFFTSNSVYLVTELVTGGELLERIVARGKYGEREAARTIFQVLKGYLIYTRLLENILLKTPDEDAVVKIADFGLSKIFAGSAILSTICGSPQYVAPEVLEVGQKRASYSPAADLWSVGVILYILLCGFSPFDDVSESALFKKIKKGQYSFKAPVWEAITDDAKDLVSGLLCVSPDKRLTANRALAHPWIKKYSNTGAEKIAPLSGDEQLSGQPDSTMTDPAVPVSSEQNTSAMHFIQGQPYAESTASDDESDHPVLVTDSSSDPPSSLNSTGTQSWSPTHSASNLQSSEAQSIGMRSQTPERFGHSPRAAQARVVNPWLHAAALKHKMEYERKATSARGRNSRFTDMNF